MPENVKGPFGIFKHPFCCKLSKKLKGDSFETLKKFQKCLSDEKKSKGDPLVSSGFVCYAKKGKAIITISYYKLFVNRIIFKMRQN